MSYTFHKDGREIRVMDEIHDKKYGLVLDVYIDHVKHYIIRGEVVTDQAVIDYLDDLYGIPVKYRGIVF